MRATATHTFQVGDTVVIANHERHGYDPPAQWEVGTEGTVKDSSAFAEIPIIFVMYPDGRQYWSPVANFAQPVAATPLDIDGTRAALREAVGKDDFAKLGGQMYTLTKTDLDVTDIVTRIEDEAVAIIRQHTSAAEARERQLERRLANAQSMPNISAADVASHDIRIYKGDGAAVVYVLPFKYAVTTLYNGSSYKQVAASDRPKVTKNIFIAIYVQGGRATEVELQPTIKADYFAHYHSDCFGTFQYPKVSNIAEVVACRNQIQSLLSQVNVHDTAGQNDDMPGAGELWERGTPLEGSSDAGVFSSGEAAQPRLAASAPAELPPEQPASAYHVGQLVQVVGSQSGYPPEHVGVVGKVTRQDGQKLMVEMVFPWAIGGRTPSVWLYARDLRPTLLVRCTRPGSASAVAFRAGLETRATLTSNGGGGFSV